MDTSSIPTTIATKGENAVLPDLTPAELEVCTEVLEQVLERSQDCSPIYPDSCPNAQEATLSLRAEIQIFLSTFLTIFLAEVGDKTQLTVLLMSAQSHAPWIIFLGAGAALVATSLCGVLLGKWLSTWLSPRTLERAAGILLLGIATLLVWDVWHW